jgi:spermidine dehydrogenase|tara:strand:- start:155 stop:2128 length:1974 start_codon:yes stop_codon:yes gene_type:complete
MLGMNRDITRRDFINGASVAIGSTFISPSLQASTTNKSLSSAQNATGYYPPILEGMRGSHPGSFEIGHLIRDGKRWDNSVDSVDTGEMFDLVVVGGGISGLAAAYFFQKEHGLDTRILIIENHDDFGGHAKRNEFRYKDRMLLDLGGAEFIENPSSYPEQAKALINDLGIDTTQSQKVFNHELYSSLNLRGGIFFESNAFAKDKLVAGKQGLCNNNYQSGYVTLPAELENSVGIQKDVRAFLDQAPLSTIARDEIIELFAGETDYLPGMSLDEKVIKLRSLSYKDFLKEVVGVTNETLEFFHMWRASYMGNGLDLTPTLNAMGYGLPGVKGLGLNDYLKSGRQPHNNHDDFHFPDGNASVARLIVRRLIPDVASGNTMHDILSARFDYSKLDQPNSPIKLRLNSTAVKVQHLNKKTVEITYVEGQSANRIRAKNCIMACYHSVVPYICSELPEEQKEALRKTIRMPLVSISVLLDNWSAFKKLGIKSAYCPSSFATDIRLAYPLKFDDYESATKPEEPIMLHMYRIPVLGDGTFAREQFRLGRHELLAMPFEVFERNIRDQLARMLKDGGFDPAQDIKGITVNRWPHGYAVGYNYESESIGYFSDRQEWPDEKRLWLTGRTRYGRIAFANSDANASAMNETAIEQAYRATQELTNAS